MTTATFGLGYACLDEETGAILGFRTEIDPERNYLLSPDVYWHTIEHYWGAGYVCTDIGAAKWNAPHKRDTNENAQFVAGMESHCATRAADYTTYCDRAQFDLSTAGLQLLRSRCVVDEQSLVERYVWKNITDQTLQIELLSVQTPWNDWYPSGMKALNENINAHIYTAGTQSWVLAEPMSGIGKQSPALGLIVREGALYSYSIESRTEITGSNTRGHIVLNVTDYARNAQASGGQSVITLQPEEEYVLSWELNWYCSREEFLAATQPLAVFDRLAQQIGGSIHVDARQIDGAANMPDLVCIAAAEPAYASGRRASGGVLEQPSTDDLHIMPSRSGNGWEISADRLGAYIVELREHKGGCSSECSCSADSNYSTNRCSCEHDCSCERDCSCNRDDSDHRRYRTQRVEVLFHDSLEHTVQHVSDYIVHHHIAADRPGVLAAGIVPVDTRTGIRVDDGGWPDWTDGSERISMAIMLTKALRRGWIGTQEHIPEVGTTIEQWRTFALQYLVDNTYATRRGSSQPVETFGDRIYDVPWLTEFFCDHYELTHNDDDLDIGVALLERMAELGAEHFLAIGYSEVSVRLAKLLRSVGRDAEAQSLEQHIVNSAQHFLSLGRNLPDHEVAYEQSITAPLVNLMIEGYRLTQDQRFIPAIQETLTWLLAFGGPQPSVRLYGIGLRHWDGHWFGVGKQFGDVFPHYWTMLTATALVRLPQELRSAQTDALAQAIAYANLSNINSDGSGTCAFMYPSSIDGQAQSQPDPMSNDQYWHLALWMRLIDDEGFAAR